MQIERLAIHDVFVINPKVFSDDRGFFYESFNHQKFEQVLGRAVNFVQDNHSKSSKGILRGLHYQSDPMAQGKLVRVIKGEVFDVAVDLRQGSNTFGKWVGQVLSEENKKMMWVPEGFAHGFLTLSDNTEFLYKTTNYYSPDHECAIHWKDADLAIDWPLSSAELSLKDQKALAFREAKYFLK